MKKSEFEKCNMVYLKIALMKRVMRLGKKRKLSPRFIGDFEILERIEYLAYCLALSPKLASVHNVLYVSMLSKYMLSSSHVLSYESRKIQEELCTKRILLVKILWKCN